MKKITCIVIIMIFLISGCSINGAGETDNNNVEKSLKVKDSKGNILQIYNNDEKVKNEGKRSQKAKSYRWISRCAANI